VYNSQQLSASAGEKCPATIKLVLMLGSLQCSRQFFREIYGSIIHCCDEKVKLLVTAPPLRTTKALSMQTPRRPLPSLRVAFAKRPRTGGIRTVSSLPTLCMLLVTAEPHVMTSRKRLAALSCSPVSPNSRALSRMCP
jgi:hypothetical protein